MTIAVFDPELRTALEGDRTPKFLATLDMDGQPNCVPVISLTPYGEDTLLFAEFFMNKTRRNLLANPRVGIAVYTEDFHGWMLMGVFEGFETSGERVDLINQTPMFRYNAYTSIRAAGRIRITEVSKRRVLSPARLYCDFALVTALATLPRNAEMAVAILTQAPIAYQAKGRYQGRCAGTHYIDLTARYSASPPLLGERLDTP